MIELNEEIMIKISAEGWQNFVSFLEERDSDIELGVENFGLLREISLWVKKNCYSKR